MFRFSTRELMLVTLAVALAVAWFVEHRRVEAAGYFWRDYWEDRWTNKKKDLLDRINSQLKPYDLETVETMHYGVLVLRIQKDTRKDDDPFGP
jgi:hypothetical protein